MDYRTAYERLTRAVGKYIDVHEAEMHKLISLLQELEERYVESSLPPIQFHRRDKEKDKE